MRRRLTFLLLALVVGVALGALWWVGQTAFVGFALDRAVLASGGRLSYGGVEGSLFDGVRIGRIAWREPPADGAAQAKGLAVEIDELRVGWSAIALLQHEVDLTRLSAHEVRVSLPASDAPAVMPESLALPVGLRLRDVSVGRLVIDREGAAPVELRDLALAASYRPGEYRIEQLRVGSDLGEAMLNATLGDAAPYPLRLGARASAVWREVSASVLAAGTLEEIRVSVAASAPLADADPGFASARLVVRPFDREPLGPLELELAELDPAQLGAQGAPRMRLSGSARAQLRLPDAESGLRATGEASLRNALAGRVANARVPLEAVSTPFEWREGRLTLGQVRAELSGGGRIDGPATVDTTRSVELFGTALPVLRAEFALRDVDLSQFAAGIGRTRLAGRARADAGRVEFDLADGARGGVAVGALLRVEGRRLEIEHARIRAIPGLDEARLEVAGSVGLQSPFVASLEGRYTGLDPAKLPAVLAQFTREPEGGAARVRAAPAPGREAGRPAEAVAAPDAGLGWLARLAGSVGGRWALQGPLAPKDATSRRIEFDLSEGTLAGRRARASVRLAFAPGRVHDLRADLSLGEARAEFSGALGGPGDRMAFALRMRTLAGLSEPLGIDEKSGVLAGSLRAEGSMHGSLLAPAISAKLSGADVVVPGRLTARGIDVSVGVSGWEADSPLELHAQANGLTFGARSIRSASATATGPLSAHEFRVEILGAKDSLRLSGSGALREGRWQATLATLATDGALVARLDGPMSVSIGPGDIELGAGRLVADYGAIAIRQANWRAGRFALSAHAAIQSLGPVAELLGVAAIDREKRRALDAVGMDLQVDVSGSAPTDVTGSASARVQGAPGSPVSGRADLKLSEGSLSGPIELNLTSLTFTERIAGPEWLFDGRVRFSGEATGTLAHPRLKGTLQGEGLRLEQRALGWRLGQGTLSARFDGETLEVESLRLASLAKGGGSVEMRGRVLVQGMEGSFDFTARRLVVPIGPGQRVVLSGNANVASTKGRFEIRGKLKADEGNIELVGGDAPTLPDDVRIRPAAGAEQAADAPPAAQPLRIDTDVELDLGENLRVYGSGVDARLAGTISLRGSLPDALRAYGTVRVRDGTYTAYGRKLQITRSRVVFNGPLDNPVLDIVALRRDQRVEAGVALSGTVLDPRVKLISIPDVPDAEKLSWLVLGVALDSGHTGDQSAALQAAAMTLLGGKGGGVTEGVRSALALDVMTVRGAGGGGSLLPSGFGESTAVPGHLGSFAKSSTGMTASDNVFVIGKKLASNVLVTFEQGLSGATSLVSIQYDFARRFSLRAQSGGGTANESAVDLIFRYPFD